MLFKFKLISCLFLVSTCLPFGYALGNDIARPDGAIATGFPNPSGGSINDTIDGSSNTFFRDRTKVLTGAQVTYTFSSPVDVIGLRIFNETGRNTFLDVESIGRIDVDFFDASGSTLASFNDIPVPDGTDGDPFIFTDAGRLNLVGVSSFVFTDIQSPAGQDPGVAWRDVDVRLCPPQTTAVSALSFTRGKLHSGDLASIQLSDGSDLTGRRSNTDIHSRMEVEFEGVSPKALPECLKFGIEGCVFARFDIIQTIELFNYDLGAWEIVDTRLASRFVDELVEIELSGILSRFVEPNTNLVEARFRFDADSESPRQKFLGNIDYVYWIIK